MTQLADQVNLLTLYTPHEHACVVEGNGCEKLAIV